MVYEAVNMTLKEMLIGSTSGSIEQVWETHRAEPPASIAHWSFKDHKIVYRTIEQDLPERDVRAFAEGYARTFQSGGWKTFLEPAD